MMATLIGRALDGAGGQLLVGHLEAAVAVDGPHLGVGRPILAPIAAGTAKPMVPRPPELIHVRGFSYLMNCAAHIWC